LIRDVDALTGDPFDLLVIGGGIHGLFAAYDAAQRGLRVALVERRDFGSGLTFNHQRTLHGGLRMVERGSFGRARGMIHERRTWARIAPHLIRPLPFLIGTYRFSRRSPLVVRAGFKLYDVLGRQRNDGVSPELHLPRAKLESAAATRRLFPGVEASGLAGGAVWYDYQTRHPDRLTWTVALGAAEAGAVLVNHAEAIAPIRHGGAIAGARVRDAIGGREIDVQARATLLAAGAGLRGLMDGFGVQGAPPLVRAMNLLLHKPARDIATAAKSPSGRMLTCVPWQGQVLIGTHQSPVFVDGEESAPPAEAIEAFMADIQATFPAVGAAASDIRLVHHGLVPATLSGGRTSLLPESKVIRHAGAGAKGLLTLVGTKYTTARRSAAHAVDAVMHELGRSTGRCRTDSMPLPHAGIADVEGRLTETQRALGIRLDRDTIEHLSGWYGTEAVTVLRYCVEHAAADRLTADRPLLRGEFGYAVDQAAALRLSDAVMRRTPLGSAGHPGPEALARAADAMGERLGWTPEVRAAEIADVERVYPR
jgi:glycerol-3-phosphate dehydrogenase